MTPLGHSSDTMELNCHKSRFDPFMKKITNFMLLSAIAVMYATVCMETDIYVPAFPDMKHFFSTSAEGIQQILSINFVGLCLGSLLLGPLSDSFGRIKILRGGLILFAFSSWCCCTVVHLNALLFWRLLQGMGAAAPMVITFAILLERFDSKKVAQLCGALNIFITGVTAAAPILGSFLNLHFGWQANFLVIAALATISLLASLFFVPETLPVKDRNKFSLWVVIKNYKTVLTSFQFMAGSFICYLMFACLILFIANLSIIFIEYLGVPKEVYPFYQASPLTAYALFSLCSIWLIGRFGIQKTKHSGVLILFIGMLLLIMATTMQQTPWLICAAMIVYTTGITFAAPLYGMEAANVFPQMRGIATGMSNALRHIIVASVIGIGSLSFDGSIKPVAYLIGFTTGIIVILAMMMLKQKLILAKTLTE